MRILRRSLFAAFLAMSSLPAMGDQSGAFTPAQSTGIAALDQVDLATKGKDIRIDDPEVGEGYWTLFIPKDYDPDRKWPLIFNFHYKTGHPNGGPLDSFSDKKGYIIVGLGYFDNGVGTNLDVIKTLDMLKRLHEALEKKLNIEDRLLYIGGRSQGGLRGSVYFDSSVDNWAGAILVDAGREPEWVVPQGSNPNYAGKSVYIGDGEHDSLFPLAKQSADYYQQGGADVTFEVYKNLGHAVDFKSKTLKKWLLDHGPLMAAKLTLGDAEALQKSGKMGQAYVMLQHLADRPDAGDSAATAKSQCDAIEADANKRSALAEADLTAGKRTAAFMTLSDMVRQYAGSSFGDKAKARLAELRASSSTSQPSADAGQSSGAERSNHPAPARQPVNDADVRCKGWMSLADGYIQNGDNDKAKVYLQKIIDGYPTSSWADTARKKLQSLQ